MKVFDARMDKSVLTMDHGQPVESLLLFPSEGLLVSAGWNSAKFNTLKFTLLPFCKCHTCLGTLNELMCLCSLQAIKDIFFSFSGGRYVKVWDLLKGGQPLVSLKNHHKTVTCLHLGSNGQRLLSASLDRYSHTASTSSNLDIRLQAILVK